MCLGFLGRSGPHNWLSDLKGECKQVLRAQRWAAHWLEHVQGRGYDDCGSVGCAKIGGGEAGAEQAERWAKASAPWMERVEAIYAEDRGAEASEKHRRLALSNVKTARRRFKAAQAAAAEARAAVDGGLAGTLWISRFDRNAPKPCR